MVISDEPGAFQERLVKKLTSAAPSSSPLRERYRLSLLSKRAGEFRKACPLTSRLFPKVVKLYEGLVRAHPAPAVDSVLSPGVEEGLRALSALRDALSRNEALPEYLSDVLAYELLSRASREDGRERTLLSRFHLPSLARDLESGLVPLDPERGAFRFVLRHKAAPEPPLQAPRASVPHSPLVGVAYRRPHRRELLSTECPVDVLEVMAGHFFANPTDAAPLAARYPIVLHEVSLSMGTRERALFRARALRVREVCRVAKPLFVSDHVAMTRSPGGRDVGHLCPLRLDPSTLDWMVDRVHELQDLLSVPIALENIAWPFQIPESTFSEADFFCELVARTGAKMLLDLENLVLNAKNFGFDPLALARGYPLSSVCQVHLAGGAKHQGFFVDSHSAPVQNEVLSLLSELSLPNLVAAIVEWDEQLPPLSGLVTEALRARRALRHASLTRERTGECEVQEVRL